jgi:hypothetical protein
MFRQLLRDAKERVRLFMSERGRGAGVLRGPGRVGSSSLFVACFRHGYGEREARDVRLLKEWLSPEQFAQYDAKSYFEVIGCHSGKRFRISKSMSINVHELDGAGRPCVGRRGLGGPQTRSAEQASDLPFQPCASRRWRRRSLCLVRPRSS